VELSRREPKPALPGSLYSPAPLPFEGARRTANGRNVTANANITSVGNLSGRRIYIEDIYPAVDAGRFPVKRIVDEPIEVWADIFRDGHAVLAAELMWRAETETKWRRVAMRLHNNDRWSGSFTPVKPGRCLYAIEAWTDVFATWRRDFVAKRDAGQDVALDAQEGRELLASLKPLRAAEARLIADLCHKYDSDHDHEALLSDTLAAAAAKGKQDDLTRSTIFPLTVDRPLGRMVRDGATQPGPRTGSARHLRRLHRALA